MSDLREAARRALTERSMAPGAEAATARVERVTLEVVAEGQNELVTLSLREGRLLCVASDGREDGPHVSAALRLLAGFELSAGTTSAAVARIAEGAPREQHPGERAVPEARPAACLEDVVTAVARVGVLHAASAPSVTDALERLLAAVPSPTPIGLARWVGRLREALARRDPDLAARLLEGAARTAADLRAGVGSAEARIRLRAWWGQSGEAEEQSGAMAPPRAVTLLHERRLVEVGREYLAGLTRAELQRRYMVDLESGAFYCEDRRRDAPASIGSCPRTLRVGLGRAFEGAPPATVQLLQYEVTPEVEGEAWLLLEGHAERDFTALAERYRQAQRSFPGQAEPFALIAPERCDFSDGVVLEDPRGCLLPLARLEDKGAAEVLDTFETRPTPTWIAGRLVDTGGFLFLVPVAAAWGAGQQTEHLRLR